MKDHLTEDTKAIIMLYGVFGNESMEKTLSLSEYNNIVRWLIQGKMRPADLLRPEVVSAAARGANLEEQRLVSLLGRGLQLGFAVEEWQRSGIWVISRSDDDYPARYKTHLKDKAPPLLFGAGERSLLKGGGLGMVGSRNIDKAGEDFALDVAEVCAANQMPVVSGGARGVDQVSMRAALDAGGTVIGVLADSLLKSSLERSARQAIADGRLLLLSPYHPNARFTVGTAMARNKLIYAMTDYTLVVSAEHKKGGTWAGAEEELKRNNRLPVFVRTGGNVPAGNSKLLELGAIAWPGKVERENLKRQLDSLASTVKTFRQAEEMSLFDYQFDAAASGVSAPIWEQREVSRMHEKMEQEAALLHESPETEDMATTVYQAVLPIILGKLDDPITCDELARMLEVNNTQLNAWLKQAVIDKKVRKLTRPVRYQRIK
jgi:predicted Rossmann fold nucleotide-binding protein DprA/Smf involved in DNA uptake